MAIPLYLLFELSLLLAKIFITPKQKVAELERLILFLYLFTNCLQWIDTSTTETRVSTSTILGAGHKGKWQLNTMTSSKKKAMDMAWDLDSGQQPRFFLMNSCSYMNTALAQKLLGQVCDFKSTGISSATHLYQQQL